MEDPNETLFETADRLMDAYASGESTISQEMELMAVRQELTGYRKSLDAEIDATTNPDNADLNDANEATLRIRKIDELLHNDS